MWAPPPRRCRPGSSSLPPVGPGEASVPLRGSSENHLLEGETAAQRLSVSLLQRAQVSSTSGSQTGGSITLSCVMADRWRAAKAKPEAGPIEGDCRDMCQGRGGDAELHLACACKGLPMTPTTKTW